MQGPGVVGARVASSILDRAPPPRHWHQRGCGLIKVPGSLHTLEPLTGEQCKDVPFLLTVLDGIL